MQQPARILLIDFDDTRRVTRVQLLRSANYELEVRDNWLTSEELDHEAHFDLMVVALHRQGLAEAAAYSDRVARQRPTLPILLLTDYGVFAPKGTLSRALETGEPALLLRRIAEMLAGSDHIREYDEPVA